MLGDACVRLDRETPTQRTWQMASSGGGVPFWRSSSHMSIRLRQIDITRIIGELGRTGADASGSSHRSRPVPRDAGDDSRSGRRAEFAIPQRPRCVEQPLERVAQLRHRAPARRRQIASRVLNRARQHVQVVVQRVELVPGDHELVLAQLEFGGPLTGHPVPLTTSLAAELPRSAAPRASREHPSTPPAPCDRLLAVRTLAVAIGTRRSSAPAVHGPFRHDEIVVRTVGADDDAADRLPP